MQLTDRAIQAIYAQREQGISSQTIARACGIAPSTLSAWVHRRVRVPAADARITRLAIYLKLPLRTMTEGDGRP